MPLEKIIRHIRHEITVGSHFHECFADEAVRREGWKRICAARRISRRLKLGNIGR